ncbi:hypothetical protein BATDEDRAFT_23951 [Batrachochytrium dendrobatidis JAM81]|uniref:Uncharacterized protein n=1 Tax=Batrachochytrium dendrobatidis (strain JAM81 / FGSC 10211) TaxID=684364 RepID=F4P000_BATDJ|nr:uncharacterized protein BATDEDRAFT_23951 [Batrachochytrium dendrobatidis JAM81]EGF81486.1 hypothetical protein BATDEDRAFT_23951 [Batrachochytrium dendrobatidis JAM81]KAK5669808.1 hypothetical protein QVD99_004186 [Batrachochytrium dendrobatidis]|eukprot:XP_006677878.1 hypothetical protein BATDEDRAFT_23951 [Batrachochytrium dendrobatidis JAM81]
MKINALSCLFLAATAKAMILSSSSDSISILEKRQTPPNEPNPSTSQQSNPSTSQQSHPSTSQQSNPSNSQQSHQSVVTFEPHSPEGPFKPHSPEGPFIPHSSEKPFRHILDGAPPLKASDLGYDDDGTPLDKNDPRCKELSTAERCIRAAREMTPSLMENGAMIERKMDELQWCQEKYERMELRFKSYNEDLNQQRSSPYKSHRKITLEKLEAQAQKCKNVRDEVEKMMDEREQMMAIIRRYNIIATRFKIKDHK